MPFVHILDSDKLVSHIWRNNSWFLDELATPLLEACKVQIFSKLGPKGVGNDGWQWCPKVDGGVFYIFCVFLVTLQGESI